jgi:peptide-methionine (R)-S-oxide reductase
MVMTDKDDVYWRGKLTPDEYHVLRQKGTERAFTGEYWNTTERGVYTCRGCGEVLFESESKFDAGCGWPSFDKPAAPNVIDEERDASHGMLRTEVLCQACGGHLGHVFPDGPTDTGLRYCINSLSIDLKKDE